MKWILSLVFFCFGAQAYIPSSQFIFDKVAALHGRGTYLVEQEVLFQMGGESTTVKESWLIVDGSEMRLVAVGPNFKLTRLLKRGRIYWVDEGQSERADEPKDDYYMPSLIIRTPAELKKIFVKWQVLPPESMKDKKAYRDLKEVKYEPEKFVRLGRVAGAITYAFGKPSTPGALFPGLWIHQDEFVIRKMRSPTGAEVINNDFAPFSRGLWYPKNQTVSFGNQLVSIKLTKVQGIDLSNERKKLMDPAWFRSNKSAAAQWPSHGLTPALKEFYTRFR